MFRALVSFSGAITMHAGEVKDIKDKKIIKDLTDAGYIEELKPVAAKPEKSKE